MLNLNYIKYFLILVFHFFANNLAANEVFLGPPKVVSTHKKEGMVKVLFTYATERNPKRVYLAGTFNNWAENQSGVIHNPAYLMEQDPKTGNYFKLLELEPKRIAYKFVEELADGKFEWFADIHISERDKDGNSIIDLKSAKQVLPAPKNLRWEKIEFKKWTSPKEPQSLFPAKSYFLPTEKVCFKFYPHSYPLVFPLAKGEKKGVRERRRGGEKTFRIVNPFGKVLLEKKVDVIPSTATESKIMDSRLRGNDTPKAGATLCSDAPLPVGGYIVQLWDSSLKKGVDSGSSRRTEYLIAEEVTSVVNHLSEDVRYGFYAQWEKVVSTDEYARRGEMFLKAHINAVQFYDWFPAHGDYTPDAEVFEFDPFFGKKLYRQDIQGKMEGLKKQGIVPLAYVAPYATSKSLYKNFPYPMRYEDGSVRVFSEGGIQESENSAKKNNRAVWFYLMSIHRGSPWRNHILNELKEALKFGFEGFHVDSYGHGKDERYFGTTPTQSSLYKGGVRGGWDGKRMAEVLADLVDEITVESHRLKPQSLVTFNSVSEFALQEMCEKEDFAFVENWAGHSSYLDELAEMTFQGCKQGRGELIPPYPVGKRLVVAVYPKDTDEKPDVWSEESLRLILAATQAGGGSLIVLGEPTSSSSPHSFHSPPTEVGGYNKGEEDRGGFNSLSDLYYPNFKPLPEKSVKLVHDFYHFDQLMFGLTHGKNVLRKEIPYLPHPEVQAYEFRKLNLPTSSSPFSRGKNEMGDDGVMRTFTLFRQGNNKKWTEKAVAVEPLKEAVLGFRGNASKVYFATPENQSYRNPVEVPFQSDGKNTWVKIPELQTFAVIILVP